ncbi:unnamed protein product, partial [Rotaria sp. Silwood2]
KLRQKQFDKYYGNNTRLVMNLFKIYGETKSGDLMNAFDLFIDTVMDHVKCYCD